MSDRVTTVAAYSTSVAAVTIGGLTINEWAGVVGIVGVFATYFTNLYYRRRFARQSDKSFCDDCPLKS